MLSVALPSPARAAEPPDGGLDRYSIVDGCWALDGTDPVTADPVRAQATDLARYLLVTPSGRFLAGDGAAVVRTSQPSPAAEWVATEHAGSVSLATASGARVEVRGASEGCIVLPDVATGVQGPILQGASPVDRVTGFLDSHLHITAFEFLGGRAHCGRPWHPYGVTDALRDCPDHQVGNGSIAVLENLLGPGTPVAQHDAQGWPTFRDWPAPGSLTHEQTYFRWLERAWRGGLRMIVNLLVENRVLCEIYPLKQNSCDEMASTRLQAQRIRELERYVDAQAGGPGKGWLRIVTDPFEARAVMNAGKVAVVLGIELSEPFGCRELLDQPLCTPDDVDREIDELRALGVRQMFAIHKLDNAIGGVTGDGGTIGPFSNGGTFLATGHWLEMEPCDPEDTGVHDNRQGLPVDAGQAGDVLGAVLEAVTPPGVAHPPPYPPGRWCNVRGLTDLGRHAIRSMIERGIIIDVDHMGVRSRQEALSIIEAAHHAGVVSSHSWDTPDATPRILAAGGMVSLYAGSSSGYAESWRKLRALAVPDGGPDPDFGLGYGADSNGLGGQGGPRGGPDPVEYPFNGLGGTTIDRQVTGERTFDVNVDGVAHYGLYPDWIEDLRHLAGDQIVEDLANGPEAYLRMWERADGVPAAPSCSGPPVDVGQVAEGASAEDALRALGQPTSRSGATLTWCGASLTFDGAGLVVEATAATGPVPLSSAARRSIPATGRDQDLAGLAALVLLALAAGARRVLRRPSA